MKQARSVSTLLLLFMLLTALLSACAGMGDSPTSSAAEASDIPRPAGWNAESHGADAEPNYEVVFPQDRVNQLTIKIAPEQWQAMQENMTALYGEKGVPPEGGMVREFRRPLGEQTPAPEDGSGASAEDGAPAPQDGARVIVGGPPDEGHGAVALPKENPMWVPATVEFQDQTWTNVGVRYKGNSSLAGAWHGDSQKLPFKLDFDQFEDEYPEISDQRFFGFKQLSLANNTGDDSAMREAIAYDLLQQAGLVSAETAFYEVYLDYGEGPVRLGLYTMIEVIDDTVVDRVFADGSGTIYEADGRAASLAQGTDAQIRDSFQVESNKAQADWSEIQALYDVLHSDRRTSDPAGWRADLEAIFEVDSFLKWLALSAAIEHWDTYGAMTHNFYLYNNPETGKLTWISWDHNFILGSLGMVVNRFKADQQPGAGPQQPSDDVMPAPDATPEQDVFVFEGDSPPEGFVLEGRPGVAGEQLERGKRFSGPSSSLDKADVGEDWPLIRYLLDDPVYHERYMGFLQEISDGVFDPDALAEKYLRNAELLRPYVAQESSAEEFDAAVQELIDHTRDRAATLADFLANR